MNPQIKRCLPPGLVLGAALYFGWPPAEPLDLGEDIVRATSAKWQADDLAAKPLLKLKRNPFEPIEPRVEKSAEETAQVEPVPVGPDPRLLHDALQLDGFAEIGGRNWAIVNGRPRLAGDQLAVAGTEPLLCQITAVHSDHIVVQCQETVVRLRPRRAGNAAQSTPPRGAATATDTDAAAAETPRSADAHEYKPTRDFPPAPQA